MTRRVVITGLGIICPIGNSVAEVTESLRAGRCGIELVPERKEMGFHSSLSGTIKNFVPPEVPKKLARNMAWGSQLTLAAARQALADAGLSDDDIRHERTGVLVGTVGNSFLDIYEHCRLFAVEKKKLSATTAARVMASTVSANLSVVLGTRGHCATVSSACAAGAMAVGYATQAIRAGEQDCVLACGVQENTWALDCQFDSMRVFSKREEEPHRSSRPFDKDRDGLVPAGGGNVLILEERERALARGAPLYGEILGYATNSDGFDITSPSGEGAARCMRLALASARLAPEDIEYVNAHATGTPIGDAAEAQAIAGVFGDRPLVSATKSLTGHELGASSSSELIFTLLMMRHGFIAPTINLDEVDEACQGIRHVANRAIERPVEVAMSNAFGFGGVNTCVILRKGA